METLAIVNAAATITTVVAAVLVASNFSPSIMVAGFATFAVASVLWMLSGYMDDKVSLIIQNGVLLIINVFGLWRWLPKVVERPRAQSGSKFTA